MRRAAWVDILARFKSDLQEAVPILVGIGHWIEVLVIEAILFALSLYGAWKFFGLHL
jgi:hypothetical protein